MSELVFDCLDVQPERYAAAPTLTIKLRLSETTGVRIHAIALRCQLRIQPQRRRYSPVESERLLELFGETPRWGDTLKPLQFANVAVMVPGFAGSLEIDLPVPLTYDFEVVSAKYFHALEEGSVPLLLLFSGTAFVKAERGFAVEQVPWHKEAQCAMPVQVWRDVMDLYFPNSGWVRLRRDTLDALQRYRAEQALPTWDDVLVRLLERGAVA